LGSVANTTDSTDQDINARLGKSRSTLLAMDRLWKSKIIGKEHTVNSKMKASESRTIVQSTGCNSSSTNAANNRKYTYADYVTTLTHFTM